MAQEESQGNMYDYLYSKYLMKSKFDISMGDEDFVENSYPIYRDLGNVATATHSFSQVLLNSSGIKLPCNCEYVEAVSLGAVNTGSYDDIVITDADTNSITVSSSSSIMSDVLNDPRITKNDITKSQLHPKGTLVPYEIDSSGCDKVLLFDNSLIGESINVIYKAILMDEDGNPLISMKEADAIAHKMAFMVTQKKYFMDPNNNGISRLLAYIKPESERKAAAAKIPEYLSQNFWDRLLKAKVSMDRKVFYSSSKLMS
tara:strand:+ start:86 stop:859 length:774 start_codon:yes stop_codon:yes gene_type:complete